MQEPEVLLREIDKKILIATMNRPDRMNALGGGLGEALSDAFMDFRNDPNLSVMVLTGAGDRAFCAGADLRQNDDRAKALGAQSAQALIDADLSRNIRASLMTNNMELWKPVIAAINGWCLAGGCENAMGCDIRIIEEQAMIGLPEVKRGMGAKATTSKLHYFTSLGIGLEILWTGDPITATRALELGLVNEVVPKGQSLARARELAHQLSEFPVSYLRFHKQRVFQSLGMPLEYALAIEQRFPPEQTEDYRRGLLNSLQNNTFS